MAVLSSRSPGTSWGSECSTTAVFRGAFADRSGAADSGQWDIAINTTALPHPIRRDQRQQEGMPSMVAEAHALLCSAA